MYLDIKREDSLWAELSQALHLLVHLFRKDYSSLNVIQNYLNSAPPMKGFYSYVVSSSYILRTRHEHILYFSQHLLLIQSTPPQ